MKKKLMFFVIPILLSTNIYALSGDNNALSNNVNKSKFTNNTPIRNQNNTEVNFNKLKKELIQLNRLFIQMEKEKKDKEKLEIENLNKKIKKLRLERSYIESKFNYDKKVLRINSSLVKENIKKTLNNLYKWKNNLITDTVIFIPENISSYKIKGKKYYIVKYSYIKNNIDKLNNNIYIDKKLTNIISILKTYLKLNNKYLLIYSDSINNIINSINFIIKNNILKLQQLNTNNITYNNNLNSSYVRIYPGMSLTNKVYVKDISNNSIKLVYKR